MRTRILAAFATFSIGAALVGALTFGGDAAADAPAPSTKVASLTPPQPTTPPAAEQKVEAPKVKPKSHARKFLPVHEFGGY